MNQETLHKIKSVKNIKKLFWYQTVKINLPLCVAKSWLFWLHVSRENGSGLSRKLQTWYIHETLTSMPLWQIKLADCINSILAGIIKYKILLCRFYTSRAAELSETSSIKVYTKAKFQVQINWTSRCLMGDRWETLSLLHMSCLHKKASYSTNFFGHLWLTG